MEKQFINPPGLAAPTGYSHVAVAQGGRTVYVAGQIALDEQGQLVGQGDLRAQTGQVFRNLQIALEAGGATFADVVKLNIYVVNYSPEHRAVIREVRNQFIVTDQPPASTLVGVQALAAETFLIEVEAIAVVEA